MVYPYNSVVKSLQVLLKRPGFWEKCQEWRKQTVPDNVRTDIYQGNVWKELSSSGFLCNMNSLAVILNVDWFRPHKHSPGSVGVIYLVLLNLPRHERYKLENIVVVGVLPGPSEPKLTANTFLEPLVQELKALWACKERFSIYGSLFKRPIKVGLVCVSSDIPATRKIGGFLGHMASQGCSRCKKHFNSGNGLDFSGLTERIGSLETLQNINSRQKEHWNRQAQHHSKNVVLSLVLGILCCKSLSTLTVYVTLLWMQCIIFIWGQLNT